MTNAGLPAVIEKMEPEIAKALGNTVPSARFIRIAKTAINGNPDIANLERTSVLAAIMQAAQDGLVIDNKEAAIVPFKGKATYIPMVAGLVKKMRQHSDFGSLSHGIVYQREIDEGRFEYVAGDDEYLKHNPIVFSKDKGDPVGAYAVLTTKSGDKFRAVLDKEAIEKRLAKGANSPAKREWQIEFWIKTVLKHLYKIAPNSGDEGGVLDGVFREDDEPRDITPVAHIDLPPHDADGVILDIPAEKADKPKMTRAASAVMAQVKDADVIPEGYTPPQYDDDEIPM
jgi:recombination protein RecT